MDTCPDEDSLYPMDHTNASAKIIQLCSNLGALTYTAISMIKMMCHFKGLLARSNIKLVFLSKYRSCAEVRVSSRVEANLAVDGTIGLQAGHP